MTEQKTYWHLGKEKRIPSEYSIASSRLHYYPSTGFEVQFPIRDWYQQYQQKSKFTCSDWEQYSDPENTTYFTYTQRQTNRETFVDGIFESAEQNQAFSNLDSSYARMLERIVAPLLFPSHALQMMTGYLGQLAPGSKITLSLAFQAADELRRTQRIAYWLALWQTLKPDFGNTRKELWETDSIWQPLRKVIEQLLVTYDWGENFVGFNLCLKPAFDHLFLTQLSTRARQAQDFTLAELLRSLGEDAAWHRVWADELIRTMTKLNPEVAEPIKEWQQCWSPQVQAALMPLTTEILAN